MMLNAENIRGQLDTKWAAQNLIFKEVTESTNDDAKMLGEESAPHGTLVVADVQTSGRGSRGRSWETPGGSNIAMSLLVRPTAPPDKISVLTLVMGLSIAQGVEDLFADNEEFADFPQIKWPNDVVIAGKKICGILTELHMNNDNTINNVVIGVGINANMNSFPEEIEDIAGSIYTQTGFKVDRSSVVAACMKRFEENYEKFEKTFDLSLLKGEYEDRLINRDRTVKIIDHKGEYEAVALGIGDDGALKVRTSDGNVMHINAGEVSVRGLYGYV